MSAIWYKLYSESVLLSLQFTISEPGAIEVLVENQEQATAVEGSTERNMVRMDVIE